MALFMIINPFIVHKFVKKEESPCHKYPAYSEFYVDLKLKRWPLNYYTIFIARRWVIAIVLVLGYEKIVI